VSSLKNLPRRSQAEAVRDLKKGYNANIATSAVWSGVSVACGAACGKAFVGASVACQYAGYAGTAGEGVITKKFTEALSGGSLKAGKEKATSSASGESVASEACEAAGKSALKAYEKFSNSKLNEKSITNLRDETKGLNTSITQNAVTFSPGDTQNSGVIDGASGFASMADKTETCSDSAIGTAIGAIRCAASADPTLPPYVKSEQFLKDLQKATGVSADDFFSKFETPTQAIFESPQVAGLAENGKKNLSDALSIMEAYSDRKSAHGYSAANTVARNTEDSKEMDVNGFLAAALAGLEDSEGGKSGEKSTALDQLTINRRLANNTEAAEDSTISIFDRVQWRYGAVTARDRLGAQ
jgi:hypothetical protein